MSCFSRRGLPVIIASISVLNRSIGKFAGIYIIQTGKVNRVEITTNFSDVSTSKGTNSTVLAEKMMHTVGTKLIIRQLRFTGE
jgi:hypothetical protein